MLKKELIEENEGLIKENENLRKRIEELEDTLETELKEAEYFSGEHKASEHAIIKHREHRIYLEGQLDVFKRLLKTHPEQIPTREEYKKGADGYGREIISTVELPF
jgi:regulator of replication initiation timing